MDNITTLFNEWQNLQPIDEQAQRRLDDKFMLEFNYNSNHIEGNTLTYGQTELLRPLQNLHPLNFHPYTLRRMNIFDRKMPLEVIFE